MLDYLNSESEEVKTALAQLSEAKQALQQARGHSNLFFTDKLIQNNRDTSAIRLLVPRLLIIYILLCISGIYPDQREYYTSAISLRWVFVRP